jgi:hypothetical protein
VNIGLEVRALVLEGLELDLAGVAGPSRCHYDIFLGSFLVVLGDF